MAVDDLQVRDWASIEVIDNILERINNVVDYIAFAGTCKKWRSLAKTRARKVLALQPPMLLLFNPKSHKLGIFCLTDGSYSVYRCPFTYSRCSAYSQGFLLMLYPMSHTTIEGDRKKVRQIALVLLYQPFTRTELSCFPPVYKHDIITAAMSAPPSSPDCVIVAVTTSRKLLLYCRPDDSEWSEVDCPEVDFVMDVVVIAHGRVYCKRLLGNDVLAFDNVLQQPTNVSPTAVRLPPLPNEEQIGGCALLTSTEGDLYLVTFLQLAIENPLKTVEPNYIARAYLYVQSTNQWMVSYNFRGSSAFLTFDGSIITEVGPQEWKNGVCCHPDLRWYYLDTPRRRDIPWRPSWMESFAREHLTDPDDNDLIIDSFWVLPSLCYEDE